MSITMLLLKKFIMYLFHTLNKIFSIYIHKKYYIFFLVQFLSVLYPYSIIAEVNEKGILSSRITYQEQQDLVSELFQAKQEYIHTKNLLNMDLQCFNELQIPYLESITTQNSMIDLYLNTMSREGEDSFNYEEIQRIKVNQKRLTEQLTYILQSVTNRIQELQAHTLALEEIQSIIGQEEGLSESIVLNNNYLCNKYSTVYI